MGVTVAKGDVRFSVPLYTQAEAARYVNVPATTMKYWTHPFDRQTRSGRLMHSDPLVTQLRPDLRGNPSVPFIGLAEAVFIASLRRAGVPVREIRPALQLVREKLGVAYALASQRLYSIGAQLLWDASDEAEVDPYTKRELIVLKNGQYVFREVVDQYLRKIEYAADGYAARVYLPGYEVAKIVADPSVNFGRPYFASTGIPISAILSRLRAGEPLLEIADDFELPEDEVSEVAGRQFTSA